MRNLSRQILCIAAALSGLALSGCPLGSPISVECRAKDGKVDLLWTTAANAITYRVERASAGGAPATLGQTPSTTFTDFQAAGGVAYQYTVTAIGTDTESAASAPCAVTPSSPDGPAVVAGLTCRAKDGKVDVAWNAVPNATTYRVFRTQAGVPRQQIGEINGTVLADFALVNGTSYAYDVVALDARGHASVASAACNAIPGGRQDGTAPPVVTNVGCRDKGDKADVAWTAAPGAAFYRVYRAKDGGATASVGETTGTVFADFGLELGHGYAWSIESIATAGAASSRSPLCAITATGRGTLPSNQPPQITSQPLTSALEDHFYYYAAAAHDPEGALVSFALAKGPGGMAIDPTSGLLTWTPSSSQLGAQLVEVRASDPQGAFATQAFSVDAADFNEPPQITSIPARYARAGNAYTYQVVGFDPEGKALHYTFGAPAPAGMTIGSDTGLVTWTPQVTDTGTPAIVVRAVDPQGAFASQTFPLNVTSQPLDLLQPTGDRVIKPGQTLKLHLLANYANVGFRVSPNLANSKLANADFEFTPTADQEGVFDLGFEAVLGDQHDVNPVRITVQRDNAKPVLAPVSPQQLKEGETLRLVVTATDADSDALHFSAPGLALENAVFDELSNTLSFTPSFQQAGSYSVTVAVTDGRESVSEPIEIAVEDAAPTVIAIDLAVDPPQSPTFGPKQTISGSIKGEGQTTPAAKAPLVTGLSPTNVRQGREVVVDVTGRDTQFVAGTVSADFGDGISVQKIEVLSLTQARVTVLAATDAALGVRTVNVHQPSGDAPSVVAFNVEKGAARLSGVLIDSFTGQPLANARVSVQGTVVTATTDGQGRFTLDGVPPGDASVVVTAANYVVRSLPVAVQANQAVTLGDTLELDALARPFVAGGSLPREASAASLLDRGIASKDGADLTLDRARAIVQDTLLAIGGNDTGVVDEAGNQLNPNLVGSGFLTLSQNGVDLLARTLLRGETWTLANLVYILDGSLGWAFADGIDLETVRQRLQLAALDAWAKPGNPDNVLVLLLLNEGTQLDAKPPIVTPDTRFNNFQAFLFVNAFLHSNLAALNAAVDAQLVAAGIDPSTVLARLGLQPQDVAAGTPAPGVAQTLQGVAKYAARSIVGRLAPGVAWAAPAPQPGPSNSVKTKPPKSRWDAVSGAFVPALVAAAVAAIIAMTLIVFIAMMTAFVTVGLGGVAVGVSLGAILSAGALGFGSQFVAKVGIAFLADPNAAAHLMPAPARVVNQRTFAGAAGQDKIQIVFERSPTDVANENKVRAGQTNTDFFRDPSNLVNGTADPEFLDYRYHLWRFPTASEPASFDPKKGGKLVSIRTQPVPRDPNNPSKTVNPKFQEFVLDDSFDNVPAGTSYFRVVTVQFFRRYFSPEPDIPNDGSPVADPEKKRLNDAVKIAYSDALGPTPPPYDGSKVVDSARSEMFENGADIFGKLVNGSTVDPATRQAVDFAKAQVAAFKQRAAQKKQLLRDAQAAGQIDDKAISSSMRAKAVDDEIVRLDKKVRDIRNELKQLATHNPGALEANRKVALELALFMQDPGNAGKSTSEIFADFTNPARAPGNRLQAELSLGGPAVQPKLQRLIEIGRSTRQTEIVYKQGLDSLDGVRRAQSELDAAFAKAVQTGTPVNLPTHEVTIFVPGGQTPITLNGAPRTVQLPPVVLPEDAFAVAALKGELAAQERLIETATNQLGANLKGLDAPLEAAFDEMRYAFMGVSQEEVNTLRRSMYVQERLYDAANLEKGEILRAETTPLVGAETTAARELGTAEGKVSLRTRISNTVRKVINKETVLERPYLEIKLPFLKFLSEAVGPAIDIGTEAWAVRDGIEVLRSDVSPIITVRRDAEGNVQVGKLRDGSLTTGAPTLVAMQPRLLGRSLPEGVDENGSLLRPAPAIARNGIGLGAQTPVAFFDSGEVVSESPVDALRLDRRTRLLKKLGSQTRVATGVSSTGFPLPFELDPDPLNFLGLLRPSEPQGSKGKGGYLVRDFPFTDVDASLIDAGFPSDLIAVDSKGAVYLENANSSLEFGGRIFRYSGEPVQREFMGAVSYYSLDLQYGRPVQPRAMEIAEAVDGTQKVEDLFVADLDPGLYFNSAIQPTNRILRVPIHQADTIPYYANGQNRNRLVGQPYAQHPDFQMTGPSDLERDSKPRSPDPGAPELLYFSDEENIFAIADANKDGQGEVTKIVSLPGRRFSGLALDQNGHLYFADYASGEVFLLPSDELDLILLQSRPITSEEELQQRAFLLKVRLTHPGDIELDTWEQRYLVSTADGIVPFDIPTVGRLGDDVSEIHVDVIGREVPVTLRRDRGGVFIVGASSEGPFGKTVRLRVKRVSPMTGDAQWTTSTILTLPFGTSIVPGTL